MIRFSGLTTQSLFSTASAPWWRNPHMHEPLTLAAVAELAAQLPPAEQKQLAENILQKLAAGTQATAARRRAWREIRGSFAYPLFGHHPPTRGSASRRSARQPPPQPS